MKALVDALVEIAGDSLEIEVLTAQPHRYSAHRPQAEPVERNGAVSVFRFSVPLSRGRKFALLRAYLAFWRHCRQHLAARQADAVFASSARLIPAVIGARLAAKLGAYLHLDIRDLFARNFREMHRGWLWRPVNRIIDELESRTLARADSISLVSSGFRDYLPVSAMRTRLSVHPNGIDPEFVVESEDLFPGRDAEGKIEVVYAGNIGRAQGLELIVPELASALEERARFTIYGDGAGKSLLQARLEEQGVTNVQLCDAVARERLPLVYRRAHVLFLHLRPLAALEAAVPSKIFEYGASGKPILAGVSGMAAELLTAEVPNSAIFPPGNVQRGLEAFERLCLCHTARSSFVSRYNRGAISREMARELLDRLGRG